MITIKNLTVETLGEYLISVGVEKGIVYDVITKINELDNKLHNGEYVDVNFTNTDERVCIVVKVINDSKPKTWVENGEYKFNSQIVHNFEFKKERKEVV